MDKVRNTSPQALPLWERQKSSRGHRSAVDAALDAHRQRKSEREMRVQERLNIVRGMQNKFFPTPAVEAKPMLVNDELSAQPIEQTPVSVMNSYNPRQIETMYEDALLGNVGDNALNIVGKEISNPEQEPIEDVPKGSYIDYQV